ncbi:MAG TPA: tetratricopeptide repeat protein [Trebonia sp.]|nr:tetratricopeptide repeat protein [Trebonia sp.]
MTDRLIVDLITGGNGEGGAVRVGSVRDAELPSSSDEAALAWPLDTDALEDLRWYLEDYLIAPFGVYEDRGARVAAGLDDWGRSVFASVFGSGPARDTYLTMRARGDVELVFRSSAPGLLGLPWELMADPGRPLPLALDIAAVSRSLPVAAEAAETVPVPGGRLRVLMVISRPAGTGDVGYRMVARPLLDRLEAVRGTVDLVVLRPPTLDALRAELAAAVAAGTPYQVVHFDGHGVMPGGATVASSPLMFGGHAAEGVLVFEKPGGGEDLVRASQVAQVLKDAKVPVVVLNACQSAAVGKELEAAVATRLLHEGIASVVAMAFSVYAVAAAEFMAAFYEKLFAGGTVAAAVTAGRQQLFRRPGRPSPKGELPLADWVVPVHYFRREVRFPQAVVPRPAGLPSLVDALEAASAAPGPSGPGDLEPVDGVFVGRDALFYDLEAAARLKKVVVLVGPGGTGKTELAKAFGRWWRDTGGVERPAWVFWHSFEPGVATFGLDGVINEIGHELWGAEFSLLAAGQRRDIVLTALADHRMLLIWDNFESVRSMPDPGRATPPLDEEGCGQLRTFLAALAARGKSSVLITSRTPEDWLGEVRRIEVGGLARHEAAEYADMLLAPYPAARDHRKARAFGELMEWLDGHPLSLRLILPRLGTTTAEVLLARLQGTAPLAEEGPAGPGRTSSLAASVAYSYAHLAESTRRLLPAISLLQRVADADVLGLFARRPEAPARFAGATKDDWVAALDDATRVGLLTSMGSGMYGIHPALPSFLAAAWRGEEPGGPDPARDRATRALLTAHAELGLWLTHENQSGEAGFAFTVISLEHLTLGALLGYALDHELWSEAQSLIEPLVDYWDAQGHAVEADTWTERVRLATESPDGLAPRPDTPRGGLWMFVTSAQAVREQYRHHLDEAERGYQSIITALESLDPSSWQRHHLAIDYHQLGNVAQSRGRLGEAEEWYRRSLALKEEGGDRLGLANTYAQLGTVALGRGRLSEAEDWYRRALAIMEEAGDQPAMSKAYHQLGRAAQERGRLDEAEQWYRRSLALKEKFGDRSGMASTYHQLGIVARGQGRQGEAEDWYRRALTLEEEVGNRPYMASTYHQLGMVAEDQGRLGEAEEWYRKSLALSEELGNRPGVALTLVQVGKLAVQRDRLPEALAWTVRGVALFEEFPHPLTGPGPRNLAVLTGVLGLPTLEETWRDVTGAELPQAVRDYVEQQLREGDGQ